MMTRIGQRRRRRRATSLYLSSFPFANIPFKEEETLARCTGFFAGSYASERVRK